MNNGQPLHIDVKERIQLNDPTLFVSLTGILLLIDTAHTHIFIADGGKPPIPQ
jgi:hypothetical protein